MLGELMSFIVGILAFIGAGLLSYTYLQHTPILPPPVQEASTTLSVVEKEVPIEVPKKDVSKTTTVVEKKVVSNPPITSTSPASAKTNGSVVTKATTTEKTVVAPGPLRSTPRPSSAISSDLTISGVIEFTNVARAQNGGFAPLTENETLNRDAKLKLEDMFAKQYFEHVSPQGVGPADLAQAVGYAYIVVGENLALGDFGSDQGVVTAWMNSPGHRANILNEHYQEIGVAVGKGIYEGHTTWLAVQSFGMPLSACPAIDVSLKARIDVDNVTITSLRAQLDLKKTQIDNTSQSDSNYNVYVNEFNAIVPRYNSLVETSRANVSTYNAGIQAFNTCIAAAGTH